MKTIEAAQFKEHCLGLLDELDDEGMIITKSGKPIARIIPYEQHPGDLIGSLREKITVKGDTFSTGVRWDAAS